jgi:hypothetical protein
VNDNDVAVGTYYDGSTYHGFTYNIASQTFSTVNAPNASQGTFAYGINNSGYVVGSVGTSTGFIYNGQSFTTIADPNGLDGVSVTFSL